MTEQQNQKLQDSGVINLLDYWDVLWRRKKLLGIIFGSLFLVVLIFCLVTPRTYQSISSVLPSPISGTSGILSSAAGSSPLAQIAAISGSGMSPDQNLYMSVLNSRTIHEYIIEKLNLKNHYHWSKLFGYIPYKRVKYMEDIVKCLVDVTTISVADEGTISIAVEDWNSGLAADIANAYIEYLDRLITQFATVNAGRQRRFIADQLAKAEKDLKLAEENLKHYQEKNRAVSLSDQAKGAIDAAAMLKGEILASEVQLQGMKIYAKDSHPDVIKLKSRIDELKRQLGQSQYSTGLDLPPLSKSTPGHFQKEIYLPVVNVPQAALELARLTREVKIDEELYILLLEQLEQAKISEVKDTPVVQVVDHAVPANRKYKPKTIIILAVFLVINTVLSISVIFVIEYLNKQLALLKSKKLEKQNA